MTRHCSLMTAYAEGSIVGRELRDMLAHEAEAERFERELRLLDSHLSSVPISGEAYSDAMHDILSAEGAV